VAETFVGQYQSVMKKIFKRAAILTKLESLSRDSVKNVEFLEEAFGTAQKMVEV
jgi:hypothetical protein